jgi:transcriptional regulator with XRE-family HTH domain
MSANSFGELVRTHRQERGLTQAELASAANVHTMTLHYLETQRVSDPHASTIVRLSRALGVEPGDLIAPFTQNP